LREMSWALSKNETPDVEAIAKWKGLTWVLATASAHQTSLPVIDSPAETTNHAFFASMQEQADSLARRAAESRLSDDFAKQLLRALAATDSEFVASKEIPPHLLFRRAQRLVLALDRLSNAVTHQISGAAKNPALGQLFQDIRSRADFQVPQFAQHLRSFRATIESSLR